MNLKFEKINKVNNKNKIIGMVCSFLIVGFIGFHLVRNAFANPDAGYLANQTVDNLVFSNASLDYKNNVSKFTVQVTNEANESYTLKTIDVIFKDQDGKEIESLIGYIGDSLNSKQSKTLEASVDKEISNISSIEYKINK